MAHQEHLHFLETVTRRLAETFQQIHQLCLQQLDRISIPPPADDEPQEVEAQVAHIDVDSPEQKKKEDKKETKTKKIKKQGSGGEGEDRASKKKAKTLTHKPKAPASSFLLFFKQQQASIARTYPTYGVTQLTKVAAKCWNELSTEEKEPYIRHCEQQRKLYQQKMEKYRVEFPHEIAEKEKEKVKKQPPAKKDKEKKNKETPRKEKDESIDDYLDLPVIPLGFPAQQEEIQESEEEGSDSLGIV